MVKIKEEIKPFITRCIGYVFGENIYKNKQEALKNYRLKELEKAFPIKSSDVLYGGVRGYQYVDIWVRWDEILKIVETEKQIQVKDEQ